MVVRFRAPLDGAPRHAPPSAPFPIVPPGVHAHLGTRVLDPASAVRPAGTRIDPTVYFSRRLLVRGVPGGSADAAVTRLQAWSDARGLELRWSIAPHRRAAAKVYDADDRALLDEVLHTAVDITPSHKAPAAPPDAWTLLQQVRHEFGGDGDLADGLALDHLMAAGSSKSGPTWGGAGGMWAGVGGMWAGVGGMWAGVSTGFGAPGHALGVRMPVVWSASDPRLASAAGRVPKHTPVIAVLDSGIGAHPWFAVEGEGFTRFRGPGTDPQAVALFDAPESAAAAPGDSLNGRLEALAGHGTFVAGIIRQRCAHAHLLDVPVMGAQGTVAESDVLLALGELLRLHRRDEVPGRSADGTPAGRLDVVNLSMGYYHETPEDPTAAAPLALLLTSFAAAGVAVVAAAGNDATTTPFYPAALSRDLSETPPLIGVGALTPDGGAVAAFSNHGDWVGALAPGAAVVSTVPVTLQGSHQRSLEANRDDPLPRGTIDPDDYSSGFALWSGTSFAAPWIAGEVAARTTRPGGVGAAAEAVLAVRGTRITSESEGPMRRPMESGLQVPEQAGSEQAGSEQAEEVTP
ncbi:hypothetical protein CFK39_14850 [Brachybacterium avium]|uniref:Peptidase S8/S53 domain-containing protein n=1 Tax=Brachybacterium avium TaxID=2017485 RepID=A0A220UF63_9MICO|nr:S8/S53 family peptidase [Brachybacterium avium]ASK66874.1 hypothetical protein CFK39_14850 [Brachybacterium avium]